MKKIKWTLDSFQNARHGAFWLSNTTIKSADMYRNSSKLSNGQVNIVFRFQPYIAFLGSGLLCFNVHVANKLCTIGSYPSTMKICETGQMLSL